MFSDIELNGSFAKGVPEQGLNSIAEVSEIRGAPLDPMSRHAFQAGNKALQPIDLFAPDLDVFGFELSPVGAPFEQISEV
ncbi:MAG TPA: hypothetical protein VMS65_14835, partial [Polyangiaceae bacterium]|nr:hypothetical protein [Polyangiaceae bacterium]